MKNITVTFTETDVAGLSLLAAIGKLEVITEGLEDEYGVYLEYAAQAAEKISAAMEVSR